MIRVLWVSRHRPLQSQLRELNRLFGECLVIEKTEPFTCADNVISWFKLHKANELVLVAPLSVCKAILERGIKPLYAEMRSTPKKDSEVEVNGKRELLQGKSRFYRFIKFKRLESIDILYKEVK